MAVKVGWEGRFFEDFEVGDIYRSSMGRTITENDNIWFTLLTNNPNQIHFNDEYAKHTEFGKPLVNSLLTIAVITGLTVQDVSQNGVNLGWDEVRLPHPVFAGDTLYSETEVLGTRESKSRPAQGIVTVKTRGLQQEGKVVITFSRNIMVWKRDHAPSHDIFPIAQ
ncbi:MAG: MaoC family dehydratase [Chloroflexi bacterium]|nr:MaoC family dehydratase [Chloroflexota bacterium]